VTNLLPLQPREGDYRPGRQEEIAPTPGVALHPFGLYRWMKRVHGSCVRAMLARVFLPARLDRERAEVCNGPALRQHRRSGALQVCRQKQTPSRRYRSTWAGATRWRLSCEGGALSVTRHLTRCRWNCHPKPTFKTRLVSPVVSQFLFRSEKLNYAGTTFPAHCVLPRTGPYMRREGARRPLFLD
jgi:hypothetical protein